MLLMLWMPRAGTVIAAVGSLACFPLYIYFTLPSLFRSVFPGEYKVQVAAGFVWAPSSIVGIVVIGVTLYLCYWGLRSEDPS